MERATVSDKFPLGSEMPPFSLRSANGGTIDSNYFNGGIASLVVFGCNHCPYVKGTDEELIALTEKYLARGLKVVVINSNDATQYPEDGFDKMQEKVERLRLPYPYLFDENQQVAKLFDAACTPECYLFDSLGKLVYHGTINDSPRDPTKVTKHFLREAVEAVVTGTNPEPAFVHPLGCSIKWAA